MIDKEAGIKISAALARGIEPRVTHDDTTFKITSRVGDSDRWVAERTTGYLLGPKNALSGSTRIQLTTQQVCEGAGNELAKILSRPLKKMPSLQALRDEILKRRRTHSDLNQHQHSVQATA